MKLTLTIREALEAQAAKRFEAAKKAKRKIEGAKTTIQRFEAQVPVARAAEEQARRVARTKAWYERFRWSRAPDGTLLVGGRDAGTNEVLLKKHLEPTDRVVHSEEPGSPFFLVKQASSAAAHDEATRAAAQLCAAYSRAWKRGAATSDVFWVTPEQVSKTANTGEFIGKGAFMVRGEKNMLAPTVSIALGTIDDVPSCAVPAALSGVYALLAPGTEKSSDLAKKLVKKLGGTPDEWVALIPPGGAKITGWKKSLGPAARASTTSPDTDAVDE
jgi:hypothetical protein